MNNPTYHSAIIDDEDTLTFDKPAQSELAALDLIKAAFPEYMEAVLIGPKGKQIGKLIRNLP